MEAQNFLWQQIEESEGLIDLEPRDVMIQLISWYSAAKAALLNVKEDDCITEFFPCEPYSNNNQCKEELKLNLLLKTLLALTKLATMDIPDVFTPSSGILMIYHQTQVMKELVRPWRRMTRLLARFTVEMTDNELDGLRSHQRKVASAIINILAVILECVKQPLVVFEVEARNITSIYGFIGITKSTWNALFQNILGIRNLVVFEDEQTRILELVEEINAYENCSYIEAIRQLRQIPRALAFLG